LAESISHWNNLNAVWVVSDNDVIAVGNAGLILHYDGSEFSMISCTTTCDLHGIWYFAGDNIFIVGEAGTVLHYDGKTLQTMDSGIDKNLLAIYGISPTNIYAVGEQGYILQFDGSHWSTAWIGKPYLEFCGVWASAPEDVYVVSKSFGFRCIILTEQHGMRLELDYRIISRASGAVQQMTFLQLPGEIFTIMMV